MRKAMVGGLAFAAAVGTAPGLMAEVKGTLAIRGTSFTVADAVAYKADDAVVDFVAVEDGKPMKGYAEVVRVGGMWYRTGSSTRQ